MATIRLTYYSDIIPRKTEEYQTIECDSETCRYNPYGVCLVPLLTSNPPVINDEDGCLNYEPKEFT